MSLIPIEVNTEHANGKLFVNFLKDIVADAPLDDQLARGEGQALRVEFDAAVGVTVDAKGDDAKAELGIEFEQAANFDIIWPGEGKNEKALLKDYNLPLPAPEEIYLVFDATGKAGVKGSVSFPVGPVGFNFGLKTGGEAEYVYVKRIPRNTKARDALQAFFDGLRLPYGVREARHIPEAGEVIAFKYGGYLKLNGGVSWGYSVNKFVGSRLRDLELQTKATVKAKAGLKGSLDIAGNWSVEVREGTADKWVRVTVRKHKERLINIAADLSANVELDTKGLPDNPSEFMEALLGMRTTGVLNDVTEKLADPDALLKHAEKKIDDFTGRVVDAVTEKLFDDVIDLNSETAGQVFDFIKKTENKLEELKGVDDRILDVIEQYVDEKSDKTLESALDKVAALTKRLDLNSVVDSEVLDFLQRYLGEDFEKFLTDDAFFEDIKQKVEAWKKAGWKEVRDFVEAKKKALNLDKLTGELEKAIKKLKEVDTPEKFKAKVNASLRELADKLTGKVLDELDKKAFKKELEELQQVLANLESFQDKLYKQFEKALNDTYGFELSYSYTRAKERTAFIDVEINLGKQAGRDLIKDALYGNFSEITDNFDPTVVKIYPTVFTRKLRTARRLNLTVLGWNVDSLKELVLSRKTTITQEGNELIWVHESLVEGSSSRKRGNERTSMHFALQLMTRGRSEKLVDSVSSISATYDLNVNDKDTKERELKLYLRRAQDLGLMRPGDLDDLLDEWRARLGLAAGSDWGEVTIKYSVRYKSEFLLNLFRAFDADDLEGQGRKAFHLIMSAICVDLYTMNREAERYLSIAKMILDPQYDHERWPKLFRAKRFDWGNRDVEFTVRGQLIPVRLDFGGRGILTNLLEVEDEYVNAIVNLDAILSVDENTPIDADALDEAFEDFARQQRNILNALKRPIREEERFADPFFAILDQYIRTYTNRNLMEGVPPEDLEPARSSSVTLTFKRGNDTITVPLVA